MNTHSSLHTQEHRNHLPLSLIETGVCEGLDCASLKDARDWFGDVELIDVIDDGERDQFGDITGN